jgi:putative SOS response-associated peptidase YedK
MCYSAQIRAEYKKFVRAMGARLSLKQYIEIYWHRRNDKRVKIPKAIDFDFLDPQSDEEREIHALIEAFNRSQVEDSERELFKQKTTLTEAERKLAVSHTKAAEENRRIATDKIAALRAKIEDIHRTTPKPRDGRFFPLGYAPVLISENGELVVKLMRYQCRLEGKPANYDVRFPGTYNARRDNLDKFWKRQFGRTHGIFIAEAFYENVSHTKADGSTYNQVLEFRPNTQREMLVACLWSRWTAPGEPDLLSFAAITDEPPPEVSAAGHDRCIVPIKAEPVHAWLNPDPPRLNRVSEILDDRERPYYEHQLAA